MTVEEKIREMLEGPVREVGVRIDSINLEKEDNNLYLKIVIDRDEIIDIDKCVEVTNIIREDKNESETNERIYEGIKCYR